MKIKSPAFQNGQEIPDLYTPKGSNINPPLTFDQIPQQAQSLALVVSDPDAPSGTFYHWAILMPRKDGLNEDSLPDDATPIPNNLGQKQYTGPNPPSGTHRYIFSLYALDQPKDEFISSSPNVSELIINLQDHIIDEAHLLGYYSKKSS
jgi:Raf kinase inhibitor-like YbhB/YbcL family protein